MKQTIADLVNAGLPQLPPHLREWAEKHLCVPKLVEARLSPFEPATCRVWLVTDDTGFKDSSDRIVFDVDALAFGRLTTLKDDSIWYQGPEDAGFAEMVKGL